VIEHSFDLFMYPDRLMSAGLFAAASLPLGVFDAMIVALTIAIVVGWIATYYTHANRELRPGRIARARLAVYSLISREFYVTDVYGRMTQIALGVSKRLNLLSRWV
jgi:NADH-quinone oxidoreductase subunit L